MTIKVNGFLIYPEALDRAEQDALVRDLRTVMAVAPLYRPAMPRTGQPYSALMTNCGPLGWVSDRAGYRYQDRHPETGQRWPDIPDRLLALWNRYAEGSQAPEAALITFYTETAKLGLHVDSTEEDRTAPVLSVSLGDTAVFRMGGLRRTDATRSVKLTSGTVVVMGGAARLAYHGVDRILGGSSRLFGEGGRLSVTLRRVTRRPEGPVASSGPGAPTGPRD
ncbi:MAG: alpha-ketoglutarate-dependent dioxygenase AlkB [Alphaproteobacteria bacterium]